MSRIRLSIAVAAALLLVSAAPAAGATVDAIGGGLEVRASVGEVNDVRVSLAAGVLTIEETGAFTPLTAGFGCSQAAARRVTCSAIGVSGVNVEAGDGADRIVVDANLTATLDDGPGDDRVTGGPQGDVLVAGLGADTVDGAGGRDVIDYSARTDAVSVTLDGTAGDGAAGEGDDVETTVEDVRGGSGSDRLTGNDFANALRGNGGDDSFDGRGGADRFEGGSGRDLADYAYRSTAVTVTLEGTANDAGESDDVEADVEDVRGGSGNDTLTGNSAVNVLYGGAGNDALNGGAGHDDLVGDDGDDALDGGSGDDDLAGLAGRDLLDGDEGSDTADYRERTDDLVVDTSTARGVGGEPFVSIEGALGGSGDDRLTGGGGDGRFDGGPGDDVLDGGGGGDRLAGGPGRDRVTYAARDAGVTVWLNDSADDGQRGEEDDVRRDVEEFAGGSDDDRLSGTDANETLLGNGGDDRLSGNGGDDVIDGGSSSDTLEGGSGDDALTAGSGNDRLTGHDGTDTLDGGTGNDVLDGGNHDDRLAGADGDDRMTGAGGNDLLDAGSGSDRLEGSDGDDRLNGGANDDNLEGGNGNDSLDGGSGSDKANGGDGGDGVFGGDGNDTVNGGSAGDTVDGGNGDDGASGAGGDDTVLGAGGDDRLSGDGGNDRVEGGDGNDKLDGSDGDDSLDAGPGADRLSGGSGADALTGGPDADKLSGDNGADRLTGDDGADELSGGNDDDVLVGGAGPDRLDGGSGGDTADYAGRVAPIRVTNDGKADDGERAERDDVRESVDHVIAGAGNDVVRLRTDAPHRIYGEGGNDLLDGGPKNDQLLGGPGSDQLIGRGGTDTFDGGAGNDRLSGADALKETLRCGAGKKDVAVRDKIDRAIGCEKLKIGKPSLDDGRGGDAEESAPEPRDLVPVSESPGTRTGVKRVGGKGRFVSIPGSPGEKIDSRLLRDIAYLKAKYKIAITDGFALQGHAHDGEHPVGLALDIVPGPGGSWAKVDQLARWAEPKQNRPRSPFRWVGYNGDPGHGRGNHLHLSWSHASTGRGKPAPWVMTFAFRGNRATKAPSVRVLTALASRSNFRLGGKPTVKSGLRAVKRCGGPRQLVATWKAAARAFNLRASVLAAITEIESGHGCNMGPSSAGAIGWTQFMPGTWKMWGMDGDGDRKASPYNSVDAIFSTARYLRASGAPRNYRKALFAYNHATWYVNKVLARSKAYR